MLRLGKRGPLNHFLLESASRGYLDSFHPTFVISTELPTALFVRADEDRGSSFDGV